MRTLHETSEPEKAPMCCVMPPASPAAIELFRKESSSVVLPWSAMVMSTRQAGRHSVTDTHSKPPLTSTPATNSTPPYTQPDPVPRTNVAHDGDDRWANRPAAYVRWNQPAIPRGPQVYPNHRTVSRKGFPRPCHTRTWAGHPQRVLRRQQGHPLLPVQPVVQAQCPALYSH